MNEEESLEYSQEECLNEFLDTVAEYVTYWDNLKDKTSREKIEGMIFSLFVMIDGGNPGISPMNLVVDQCEEDIQYYKENEERYWPDNTVLNGNCSLHEEWASRMR